MAAKEKPKEADAVEDSAEALAEVAYYYDDTQNPDGGFFPGVPLGDLTVEQVKQYPAWVRKSIKGSPMYRPANASEVDGEGDKE